jgi:hypothetical protein
MNYVQIRPTCEGNAAHFRHMLNNPKKFRLLKGIPLQDSFPAEAAYRMSDDFPENIALHEVIDNLDRQLIVHERVRAFLEAEGVQHVEYFPVRLINHKERETKERYFVINMLPHVDCIDQSKTRFKWNALDNQSMTSVENLTLLEERIPPDFKLLRPKHLASVMLIHRALAQKMKEAKFRGFELVEISDYYFI